MTRKQRRASAATSPRNGWDLAAREFFRRAGKRDALALVMVSVSAAGKPDLVFRGNLVVASAALDSAARTLAAFAAKGPVPEPGPGTYDGGNDGIPSAEAP
jgi:hypothetical protein